MPLRSLVPFSCALLLVILRGVAGPAVAQTAASPSPSASPNASASAQPSAVPGQSLPSPAATPSASAVPSLPPAGVIPSEVSVDLGGTVAPQFALAQITGAIARRALLQPGATLAVSGVTIANALHDGDELEALAQVSIGGTAAFAGASGTTAVHLRVLSLPQLEPAFLFYSDDPERLTVGDDGVLYHGTIDVGKPVRVYAYHVSDVAGRRLFLALRATGAPARVQLLGYAAGPANAFAYVGHVSTLQYLLERSTQESVIVPIDASAPYLHQLGYRPLGVGELVAAIYDLRELDGDPVDVDVIAASAVQDPVALLGGPELPGDGHGRRGDFSLHGVPPIALSYVVGGPEPSPLPAGDDTIPNLRPGGRPLRGDYGVLLDVGLQLSNPQASPQDAYLYEQAASGTATTTIWFTGDTRPIEIPCLRDPANRYLVKAFSLAPGQTMSVGGEFMTDGTASLPIAFGLTAVPPSPPPGPYSPDACNPRPLPSPSPSPSAAPSTQLPAVPSAAPEPSLSP